MVGQIPGKMFDHPIEKDCVQIGPVRQLAGPESDAIKNLATMQQCVGWGEGAGQEGGRLVEKTYIFVE